MATAFDVARFITERLGELSAMKLHKLLYYCQAWHLVWEERALFDEDFQAWANGPVIREVYSVHRRQFLVNPGTFPSGDSSRLSSEEVDVICRVLDFYGDKTAQWLSNLSHQELPWKEARGDTPDGAVSYAIIDKSSMHEYYSAL